MGDVNEKLGVDQELAENSPYPEVRAAVPNTDDPSMPCVRNIRPPLLTSRTPFVCGLSPSCSPRSALVSTCFCLCAVPVLSLLLLLLNFSHSPLARLGADGCLPGNGPCSDTLSISIPAHSISRSTLSLWYAFASKIRLTLLARLERQLWRRCRLCHRHSPLSIRFLRSKFRRSLRVSPRHLNPMYRILFRWSHASIPRMACRHGLAYYSRQCNSFPYSVP